MRKPLEKELKSYREQGISLYLNGILSNPKTIAKACQIAEGEIRLERKSPLLSFFRGMGFQAGVFSGQIEKRIKRLNPSKVIWESHRIRQISNHAKREDRS